MVSDDVIVVPVTMLVVVFGGGSNAVTKEVDVAVGLFTCPLAPYTFSNAPTKAPFSATPSYFNYQ